jgi:uncharacterized protein YqgC (DUF456 family)
MLNLETITVPSQAVLGSINGVFLLFPLLGLATLGPTSQQIVTSIIRAARSNRATKRGLAGCATVVICVLFLISLSQLNHVTEFLYFQF